jgi:GDP-D-mannose dehydratase
MKILITGASGQDGILLIDHIFQKSADVTIYALSRSQQKFLITFMP